jgi:transposase InsO family protein
MQSKPPDDGVAAEHPNECWESVLTQYALRRGANAEILAWFDHSGYALSVTAHERATGPIEAAAFRAACAQHSLPASVLTDAGMVRKTRLTDSRRAGRSSLDGDLRRLGIARKNRDARGPQDKGIAERFQHALTRWLADQDPQPANLTQFQSLLDTFTARYNRKHTNRRVNATQIGDSRKPSGSNKHVPALGHAAGPQRSIRPPRPTAGNSA